MSLSTKSATTSSTMAKIWRKVQGTAVDGINTKTEILRWMNSLSNAKLAPSLREVTRPVFVQLGGGVASISEGGAKARPGSPPAQEISASLVHLQKQFAIADLVLMVSKAGGDSQIVKQFKTQLRFAIESMSAGVGDYCVGGSSAILATTDTDLAGATTELTLTAGYNQSWITDAAYLTGRIRAGASTEGPDYFHVLNAGSLVTNAIGYASAKNSTTGTVTLTWTGTAPSSTTNGLQLVKANSLESTDNDYNKGFVGITEAVTATSLHGLSGSTYPGWSVAGSDTTGGRLDGTRLEKARDTIEDESGVVADTVLWAKGVRRDVRAQYKAAVQFNDAYAIPMDGDVKNRGVSFEAFRQLPPGFAMPMQKAAVEKFFWKPELEEGEGSMSESDLLESEDYTIRVGRIDLVGNLVWNRRKALYYFRSLQES